MNYQHHYHVGNFADIFKHLILCLCLEKLHEKPNSFLAIDAHSSQGKYLINHEKIAKTHEFAEGFLKILNHQNFVQILPEKFLQILARINVCEIAELPSKIKHYAGSPIIIKNFLRANDKAIFAENNPPIFLELRRNFAGNKKITCLKENGFDLLKSKLPPLENRGLILLDPAYEKHQNRISQDYDEVLNSLKEAYKRFAHGIYLVWHPIIEGEEILLSNFYQKITELKFSKIAHATFNIGKNPHNPNKMHSCGMFIINMPWQVDVKLQSYLTPILEILKNDDSAFCDIKIIK